MIENERQYEVTQRNVSNFEGAIADLDEYPTRYSLDMMRLLRSGYQIELDKLRAELAEYESRRQERRSA
ncbi:MAG: hypothetical protein NTZ05_11095 [Chloroflexi bacterium]|nr:hypothetical protein [Chloroflexota bacterium]